jgi:hypothetical protein
MYKAQKTIPQIEFWPWWEKMNNTLKDHAARSQVTAWVEYDETGRPTKVELIIRQDPAGKAGANE